jgi:4-aminobutyrate aminotransferase/(S)-3-amino-2-methylpropionate transaminase
VAQDVPEVGEIRGIGAMVGVEVVTDRETKAPNEEFLGTLIKEAMGRGVIAVSCGVYHNVLRHLVPLVISDEELEEGLGVLAEAALTATLGRARTQPAESERGASRASMVEGE